LSPIYEHPQPFDPFASSFIVAGLAVMLISLAFWLPRRAWPAGAVCWAIYLVVLAPVLGFVQVGPQIAADRYTLLAATPWAVLAGAGLARLLTGSRVRRRLVTAFASVVVALLAVRTWQQTTIWHDSNSLWQTALEYDPKSWNAHFGLGAIYVA